MYRIELSAAALADLDDFEPGQVDKILAWLLTLADNPRPPGVQPLAMSEAAGGLAYLYDRPYYRLIYDIDESQQLITIVAIFKKISLN